MLQLDVVLSSKCLSASGLLVAQDYIVLGNAFDQQLLLKSPSRHLNKSRAELSAKSLIEAAGRAEREGPGGVPQTRPRALSTALFSAPPQCSAVVLRRGAPGTLPR